MITPEVKIVEGRGVRRRQAVLNLLTPRRNTDKSKSRAGEGREDSLLVKLNAPNRRKDQDDDEVLEEDKEGGNQLKPLPMRRGLLLRREASLVQREFYHLSHDKPILRPTQTRVANWMQEQIVRCSRNSNHSFQNPLWRGRNREL